MNALIKQLELGPMANFVYLIGDPGTKTAAVVDPGWQAGDIIKEAKGAFFTITHIMLTHAHFDHTNVAGELAKATNAKIYIHHLDADGIDECIKTEDGQKIRVGDLEITCMHTPGHTKGSQCFLLDSALFTGDTLFVDGMGRVDLPGGDAEAMFRSLAKIRELPGGTIIYPGHNYGKGATSTVAEQKCRNPYMKCGTMGEFLRF